MVGSKYDLSHVFLLDRKAESIASSLYGVIRSTELEKNLQVIIGSDGKAIMTRHSGKGILILEERLGGHCNRAYVYYTVMTFSGAMFSGD